MQEYVYEGKRYRRNGAKWIDASNMTVPVALQNKLNQIVFAEVELASLGYEEAKQWGDKYKASESYSYAIRYYERALDVADTYTQVASLLPRVTSCFRKLHRPERVIEILARAKKAYGEHIINEALLTSAAAAYCDMLQPQNALKCCNYAYALAKAKKHDLSPELRSVYGRATSMLESY